MWMTRDEGDDDDDGPVLTIGPVLLLGVLDLSGAEAPLLIHPEVADTLLPGLEEEESLD